jgi:hypothetical protein
MSLYSLKDKSNLKGITRFEKKPDLIAKSTISQDRTSSEQQTLLAALKDRPRNISLKGGRFEAGVGKKDRGSKGAATPSSELDKGNEPLMEEVD